MNGQLTSNSSITVSGTVAGVDPVQVTVNGQPVSVNAGAFTLNALPLMEGDNHLTVIAGDGSGGTNTVMLTVKRNSAAPVLTNVLPADGAYLNTGNITVTGNESDASPPVTVTVNGVAATVSYGQFSAPLSLAEGSNQITIQTADAAGNTGSLTQSVFIDTIPPAAFTPVADVTGWTNNNLPIITFGTTDAGSGIDHYEIAVGDGPWLSPVTSPYLFLIPLPDGVWAVNVKAVDRAGNYTIGSVTVDIDTTPPAAPAGFKAVPGDGQIGISWTPNTESDLQNYILSRVPAFAAGSSQILGTDVQSYTDTEVQNGTAYTYSITAVDHADNSSAASTAPAGETRSGGSPGRSNSGDQA